MLNVDLSDPVNQVRAIIGDVDGSWISDENITFLLTKNDTSALLAANEALGYILNMVAYYVREEAGDVEVYWSDLYNQLDARKKALEKETAYSKSGALFRFGGTSKSEFNRIKNNPDSIGSGFTQREFTYKLTGYGIDPDNPYILPEQHGY